MRLPWKRHKQFGKAFVFSLITVADRSKVVSVWQIWNGRKNDRLKSLVDESSLLRRWKVHVRKLRSKTLPFFCFDPQLDVANETILKRFKNTTNRITNNDPVQKTHWESFRADLIIVNGPFSSHNLDTSDLWNWQLMASKGVPCRIDIEWDTILDDSTGIRIEEHSNQMANMNHSNVGETQNPNLQFCHPI